MTERDGATVGVHLGGVDAQLTHAVDSLRGEGLVDLEDIDVRDLEAILGEQLADGRHRANAHDVCRHAHHLQVDEVAERRDALGDGGLLAHHHRSGGAVGERRRVARGDRALGAEGRLEGREALVAGLGADDGVALERDNLGLITVEPGGRDLEDLVVEAAGGLRLAGAALALVGEAVLLFAGHTETGRHVLRGRAHHGVDFGVGGHELEVGRGLVAAHRDHGHGLGAAGDADVDGARPDGLAQLANRLHARGAEPVDGERRDRVGETGQHRRGTGHIHALLRLGHRATEDHILNLGALEVGHRGDRSADGPGGHGVGAGVLQLATLGAGEGGSKGTGNHYALAHRLVSIPGARGTPVRHLVSEKVGTPDGANG